MLEDNEIEYDMLCDTFNTLLDTAQLSESFIAELDLEPEEKAPSSLEESGLEENTWSSLPTNTVELEAGTDLPYENVYKPKPIWERPPGHAVASIDAFKISCYVNSLKEPVTTVIGDSGAAPTLISHTFLKSLKNSKPRARTGQKLKLIQLTGTAKCSEYVRLNLYFRSQLGPVCLKGVEAYVVKGMEAKLLIGEDTQLAWQLHTMRINGSSYWKVGDSTHYIPARVGPKPKESFSVQWKHEGFIAPSVTTPFQKSITSDTKPPWNAIARTEFILLPESITTVTVTAKGAPKEGSLYLEAIALMRGSDSFIHAPHGIIHPDLEGNFQIKIANTTDRCVLLRSGELVGHLFRTSDALRMKEELSEDELDSFTVKAIQLSTLISNLDMKADSNPSQSTTTQEVVEPADTEHLGWGPKTADPGPDQVYPSDKLREVIDVNPALDVTGTTSGRH